jgi:hypothetical protein
MRNFKFFQHNVSGDLLTFDLQMLPGFSDAILTTTSNNTITTTNTLTEFCFSFNNSDPVVFASGAYPLTITLSNVSGDITFYDNDNTFRLFSRPNENI